MHFHLLQPPSSGHLPFPRRQLTLHLNLKTMTMSSKGQVRRDYHHQQQEQQCHHTRGLDLQGGIIMIDSRHRRVLVGFKLSSSFRERILSTMSYELESCGLCVQDPSLGTPRRFSRSPPPAEAEATNASSYTVFFGDEMLLSF